jgi:hypothetical protein
MSVVNQISKLNCTLKLCNMLDCWLMLYKCAGVLVFFKKRENGLSIFPCLCCVGELLRQTNTV